MTIDVRARAPAAVVDDAAPRPARRPAPARYAPSTAAKPPPATAAPAARGAAPTPPSRAKSRDAQGARQPDPRRQADDADPQTPGIQPEPAPRDGRQGGGGDGAADGDGAAEAAATGAGGANGAGDDAELEAGLQGLQDQQGIFELLLPGGLSVGVVVRSAASSVHFLLSAGGGALEQRLRQNKMELERRLQRRMQKDVRIAVL